VKHLSELESHTQPYVVVHDACCCTSAHARMQLLRTGSHVQVVSTLQAAVVL
jgi:hypothetical protein